MSSASGVVHQSKSRRRYKWADRLLKGYMGRVDASPKEVAAAVLNMTPQQCEQAEYYNSAQKRGHDLYKLGYLELVGDGECALTGIDVHKYRLTEKGRQHLLDKGMFNDVQVAVKSALNSDSGKAVLMALRGQL